MAMSGKCSATGLSVSYSYKRGCRCADCRENKARYTRNEGDRARERVRAWYAAHPGRKREHQKRYSDKSWILKHSTLLEMQQGVCAICGRGPGKGHMSPSDVRLHLDHDHSTGKERGMLCGNCNVGIGHFRDDPKLLARAIAYLKNPPADRLECVENGDVW